MSDSGGNSSKQNGSVIDPLQRLSSFKAPRDYSLGGVKTNKKIFTPNLNVTRNKNKSSLSFTQDNKKEHHKGKRDRKNDRNCRNDRNRNAKNVHLKGSGIFSQGMGAMERKTHSRMSYGREVNSTPTLERPTIRVKQAWKIDKELEDHKIKIFLGDDDAGSDDDDKDLEPIGSDAPVRLPIIDPGYLKKTVIKEEVVVKVEPVEDGDKSSICRGDVKPFVDTVKEMHDDLDIVSVLRSDNPTLILLQLPDSLPGQGSEQGPTTRTSLDDKTNETVDNRCYLKNLEEGRIGKLLIHRSGKVRLSFGDTMYEVSSGTKTAFRQEAVSVACDDKSRSANIVALGAIQHKLNLIPDWESLFKDVAV